MLSSAFSRKLSLVWKLISGYIEHYTFVIGGVVLQLDIVGDLEFKFKFKSLDIVQFGNLLVLLMLA